MVFVQHILSESLPSMDISSIHGWKISMGGIQQLQMAQSLCSRDPIASTQRALATGLCYLLRSMALAMAAGHMHIDLRIQPTDELRTASSHLPATLTSRALKMLAT